MRPAPLPFRRCDAFSKGGRPHTDQVTAATKSGTPHRRDYVTARFFFLVDNHAVWVVVTYALPLFSPPASAARTLCTTAGVRSLHPLAATQASAGPHPGSEVRSAESKQDSTSTQR